jgi:hypothetical protein
VQSDRAGMAAAITRTHRRARLRRSAAHRSQHRQAAGAGAAEGRQPVECPPCSAAHDADVVSVTGGYYPNYDEDEPAQMRMLSVMLAAAMFACTLCTGPSLSRAETVDVKYRGEVDLKSFDCKDIIRSSFIRRVCYDTKYMYMIVKLNETYYHYCDIESTTVDAFEAADSMGRFFNASIKGHFDCRTGHVPNY